MRPKAFLYGNNKLQNSSIRNRKKFGSGSVFLYLTGTYMNDPFRVLRVNTEIRTTPKANIQKRLSHRPGPASPLAVNTT